MKNTKKTFFILICLATMAFTVTSCANKSDGDDSGSSSGFFPRLGI